MIKFQFERYVASIGKDSEALTDVERENLESAMISDLYPGIYIFI